jgi:hypothetical protein
MSSVEPSKVVKRNTIFPDSIGYYCVLSLKYMQKATTSSDLKRRLI